MMDKEQAIEQAIQIRLGAIQDEKDAAEFRRHAESELGLLVLGLKIGQKVAWTNNSKTGSRFVGEIVRASIVENETDFSNPDTFCVHCSGDVIRADGSISPVSPIKTTRIGSAEMTILTSE